MRASRPACASARKRLPAAPCLARSLARGLAQCLGIWAALCASPLAGAQPSLAPLPAQVAAKLRVLDAFLGTWDVTVHSRVPKLADVTYTETFDWALDHWFIRGESSRKSDGSHELAIGTFDPLTNGYPFWLFSSPGSVITLGGGTWNEATRTMTWKSPAGSTNSFETRCIFATETTRRCISWVKDWKGTLLIDQDSTAVRKP